MSRSASRARSKAARAASCSSSSCASMFSRARLTRDLIVPNGVFAWPATAAPARGRLGQAASLDDDDRHLPAMVGPDIAQHHSSERRLADPSLAGHQEAALVDARIRDGRLEARRLAFSSQTSTARGRSPKAGQEGSMRGRWMLVGVTAACVPIADPAEDAAADLSTPDLAAVDARLPEAAPPDAPPADVGVPDGALPDIVPRDGPLDEGVGGERGVGSFGAVCPPPSPWARPGGFWLEEQGHPPDWRPEEQPHECPPAPARNEEGDIVLQANGMGCVIDGGGPGPRRAAGSEGTSASTCSSTTSTTPTGTSCRSWRSASSMGSRCPTDSRSWSCWRIARSWSG